MTTPHLSQPTLFTPSELKANSALSASIIRLVNDAFSRSKSDSAKWDNSTLRFSDQDALYGMLSGDGSVMAVIFDESEDAKATDGEDSTKQNGGVGSKKVVACAAAVAWNGGWMKEGAGMETGWEIKAISVDGDAKYHRRGLAVQLLDCLERHLVGEMRAQLRREGVQGEGMLTLWILAVECLVGAYWRKKGYSEVRRRTEGPGVWSCRTSFEMVVLKKDVVFDISAGTSGEGKAL
jgi:GNAT superfamily N-acetyltransferase